MFHQPTRPNYFRRYNLKTAELKLEHIFMENNLIFNFSTFICNIYRAKMKGFPPWPGKVLN